MYSMALARPQILALNKDKNGKLTRKVSQKRPLNIYIYNKFLVIDLKNHTEGMMLV